MTEEQQFRAVLERDAMGLGWTVVSVPFDPRRTWPQMIRLRVAGSVSGPGGTGALRTSLFPEPAEAGRDGYVLLIPNALQSATGLRLGDAAEVSLRADMEPREASLPEALDALLDEAEGLRAWYNGLTEYTRREIGKWTDALKSEESRVRRAQQMAERLLNTMEAETELPPLLQRAFQARPKARAGWEAMTLQQRRAQLMAVFSYQSPEARGRRIEKLLDAAEQKHAS